MSVNKLRVITDFEKLSVELQEQIKLVYPEGYSQHLIRFTNKNDERVSALRFETDDKIYMVRMSAALAEEIVSNDDDFDEDGVLKEDIQDKYEEKYADVDYLSENENYEE